MSSRVLWGGLLGLLWAMAAGAQPAAVTIGYAGLEGNPPLCCPCETGTPFADGTPVWLYWDVNENGAYDALDERFWGFLLNGEEIGEGPGYFYTENVVFIPDSALVHPFYLRIEADSCCLMSSVIQISAGMMEWMLSALDWTCEDGACALEELWRLQFCNEPASAALTYPCEGLSGFPAGTAVTVRADSNDNGPDSADAALYRFAMQSAGRFLSPIWFMPLEHGWYLQVDTLGCCYTSRFFPPFSQGHAHLQPGEWTCVDGPCAQPLAAPGTPPPLPAQMALTAIAPNPFNARARITFTLAAAGEIALRIYDLEGRQVCVLARGLYPAGEHTLSWEGRTETGAAVSSGLYFCRLSGGGAATTRPLLLLR